jgi:hypothetical protein
MSLHTKVSGVWKEITTGNIFVKDSGVWKDVANIFVNVSGTWTSMIFTPGNVTYTSSGTFAVPLGTNNLLIECWGGGGSGGSGWFGAAYPPASNNTSGDPSYVTMTNGQTIGAEGGERGEIASIDKHGNQTLGQGGDGGGNYGDFTPTLTLVGVNGEGGATTLCAPSRHRLGGRGQTINLLAPLVGTPATLICGENDYGGKTGIAVGGGGSGSKDIGNNIAVPPRAGGGGGGGGYVSRLFSVNSYFVGGSNLSFVVGAGGLVSTGGVLEGGAGATGQIKFTWS